MNEYLTKRNLITAGIVVATATLFVLWGFYLMRDKPEETILNGQKQPVTRVATDTPQTYYKMFDTPIDPNTQSEKHKAVYENLARRVPFKVMYPKQMPVGFLLIEVETNITHIDLPSSDIYTTTYSNTQTNDTLYIEGVEKINFDNEEYTEIMLNDTKKGVFLNIQYGMTTLYVYSIDPAENEGTYRVMSETATKDILVEVARHLELL